MPFVMLPKTVYVYVNEDCREALVGDDGTIKPGRLISKGAVLQLEDDFPNYDGKNRDLVRCRVVRSPSMLVGVGCQTTESKTRVVKDEHVVLYMRECVRVLKVDVNFQEEVRQYEESEKAGPKIEIAQDLDQAMRLFVNGGRRDP